MSTLNHDQIASGGQKLNVPRFPVIGTLTGERESQQLSYRPSEFDLQKHYLLRNFAEYEDAHRKRELVVEGPQWDARVFWIDEVGYLLHILTAKTHEKTPEPGQAENRESQPALHAVAGSDGLSPSASTTFLSTLVASDSDKTTEVLSVRFFVPARDFSIRSQQFPFVGLKS